MQSLLPEERELAQGREKFEVSERRQSELGKPVFFDSSFIRAESFGFPSDLMHEAMMGLAKLRTSEPIPRDRNLVQAIRSLDDLIETANLMSERLHEWYGMHFPELADYAKDERYARAINDHGDRGSVISALELDIESIGSDMDPEDLAAVRDLAGTLCSVYMSKERTEDYISDIVSVSCPNMCALLGGPLSARLISLAGGLGRLASLPSSTVQLMGGEPCSGISSGKRPPKHGVLYQHPSVTSSASAANSQIAWARRLSQKIDNGGEYRGICSRIRRADSRTSNAISRTAQEGLAQKERRCGRQSPRRTQNQRSPRNNYALTNST